MSNKLSFFLALTFVLPSCLQTTAELRNNRQQPVSGATQAAAPAPPPIVTKQQKEAVEALRTDDINKDFREMNGRIEVVENQMHELKDNGKSRELEAKIAQLETKINLLEATVTELHAKSKKEVTWATGSDSKEMPKADANPLREANKLYDKQKWDEAILAFEEYRKNNPKGSNYADATYKIGVCFQSMGMKDDAKAFFKEVVDKYPKSKEAGLAKSKLKKL